MIAHPPIDAIVARMTELGFVVFAGKGNLNIVGLRRKNGRTGVFDDMLVAWADGAPAKSWPITTDPGGRYLAKPLHEIGTAVLAHDRQFRGSHRIGIHGASKPWAHRALVQVGDLVVWHDANKDNIVDYGLAPTISHGTSGINIHRNLGDFSAGCQVFQNNADHDEFMAMCDAQVRAGLGDRFSYTLLLWELPGHG